LRTAPVIQVLAAADQVYVCLWSHAGWEAVHIHFVLQPAWNVLRERYPGPGPLLQVSMFAAGEPLDPTAVQEFCDRARRALQVETPSSRQDEPEEPTLARHCEQGEGARRVGRIG